MKKVILITGASSGFGRLTALAMLAKGHTVYASMRNINGKNAPVAQELSRAGASVIELDVTDGHSIQTAINTLTSKEDKLDVLINNAGVAAAGISESFSDKQVQAMFDVNVFGLFRVTQAVLPLMRKHNDGLILNVGSILGRVTFPFYGLYGCLLYTSPSPRDV